MNWNTFNLVAERASFVLIKHNVFGEKLLGARGPLGLMRQWCSVREALGPIKAISSGDPQGPWARAWWAEGSSCLKKKSLFGSAAGSGGSSGGAEARSNGSAHDCNSVNPSHRHSWSNEMALSSQLYKLSPLHSGIWLGFRKGFA